MKYAARTSVGADRSRSEIERILARYGATQFAYGWSAGEAMIGFQFQGRLIRFTMALPRQEDGRTKTGRKPRNPDQTLDQMTKQKWRALALGIKAKLELVESGITTFEREFLAHVVLPNGQTFGDWAVPQIDTVYRTGAMPPLLPAPDVTDLQD